MNNKTQNIIAVITGYLLMIAIEVALIPVMQAIIKNAISYSLKTNFKIDYTSIYFYSFLNFVTIGFIGGFIACWMARDKKLFYVLLTGALAFVTLVIIWIINAESNWTTYLFGLTLIPLTFIGGIVRRIIENKNLVGKKEDYDQ